MLVTWKKPLSPPLNFEMLSLGLFFFSIICLHFLKSDDAWQIVELFHSSKNRSFSSTSFKKKYFEEVVVVY